MTTFPAISSAMSRTPWRARRDVCIGVARACGADPNAIADAMDSQLEDWREQEGAQ
jgi:hypothetical protein